MAARPAGSERSPSAPVTHRCLVLLILAVAGAAAPAPRAESPLRSTTFELQHRTFEELRPLLEPLLEPAATLSGRDARLIVRAPDANLAEIRAALAVFDTPARRLRVSVLQVHGGDRAGATPQDITGAPSATGTRYAHTQGRDERIERMSVLTLDGVGAWIATVEERAQPYVDRGWGPYVPPAIQRPDRTQTRSGFSATPHVLGSEVRIEISADRYRFLDAADATSGVSVDSVVSGRLGEWLPVGGTATRPNADAGTLARTRRPGFTRSAVWLRVDLEP